MPKAASAGLVKCLLSTLTRVPFLLAEALSSSMASHSGIRPGDDSRRIQAACILSCQTKVGLIPSLRDTATITDPVAGISTFSSRHSAYAWMSESSNEAALWVWQPV
jgi:hypothetical protein